MENLEEKQSQDSKSTTTGESNPLLFPPIVQNIVGFLSMRDVLSVRQVCKEWNKSACIKLRSTKTIKLSRKPELLEEYTNIMRNSVDLPFAKYELEFYHMGDPVIEQFLLTCGNSITSLQLNNCRCTVAKLWEILTRLQSTLANFSINCDAIEISSDQIPQPIPLPQIQSLTLYGEFFQSNTLIRNLIESCSNLSSLRFKCFDPYNQESPFEIMCFNIFLELEMPNIYENLTGFQMESRLNDTHILNFCNKTLSNLQFLHISLEKSVQPASLANLLGGLSKSLIRLEIDFEIIPKETVDPPQDEKLEAKRRKLSNADDEPDNNNQVSNSMEQYYMLPQMNVLRRLSLSNYKGSLAFLNNCEKLKYLTLVNCNVSLGSLVSVEQHSNLICFVSTIPIDSPTCIQLARVFPNLKTLNVILDDEVLSTVFQVMHSLEELILSGDQLTDEGITGAENVFQLMTIYNSMENMEEHLQQEISKIRKVAYIGNLTNLKKIHIQNAGFITDASVFYGISHCHKLEEISLLNSEVTDASLTIIGNKFPQLKKLEILSNIPRLTEGGKLYIRNKIPNCDFILGQSDIMNLYRTPKPATTASSSANTLTSPMEVLLDLFY